MVASARDFAQAKGFIAPPAYGRHRPETTLLSRLVALSCKRRGYCPSCGDRAWLVERIDQERVLES